MPGSPEEARAPFPAPAGMNRGPGMRTTYDKPVPRTRGDEPTLTLNLNLVSHRSPHPRG